MNKEADHSQEEQPPQAPSVETPKEDPSPKKDASAAGSPRQLLEELDKMARSGDAAAEAPAPAPQPPVAPTPDAAMTEEPPAAPVEATEEVGDPSAEATPSPVPPPEEPAAEQEIAVPEAAEGAEPLPDDVVDPAPVVETESSLPDTAPADVTPSVDIPSAQPAAADVPVAASEPAVTADDLISDAMKQLDGLLQELKARPPVKDAGDDSVG